MLKIKNKKIIMCLIAILFVANLGFSNVQAVTLQQRMFIDTLLNNAIVNNENINISGWALNASGISSVNVYLDEKLKGTAEIGLSRPDVNAVFPGYLNGDKSGFKYVMDINTVSPGQHKIAVEAIGSDGSKQTDLRYIEVRKAQPRMFIDNPQNNYSTSNNIKIQGWALNSSGIKLLNMYVDDKLMGTTQPNVSRPDVNMAFTGYPNGDKSGFDYTLNIVPISAGNHKISVEAIGNDGTKQNDIRYVSITKASPRIYVDGVSNSLNYGEADSKIDGWALNSSGIKSVDIYLDDSYMGAAQIGINRPDVNAAFPGYPNGDKSGYSYILTKDKITLGKHKITIQAVGNDDTKQTIYRYIERGVPDQRFSVDTPQDNLTSDNSDIQVGGWAVNKTGIKEVRIYVDGTYNGSATLGVNRPDVNAAFPGYLNSDKAGFDYKINVNNISPGSHLINIEAEGNDGTKQSLKRTITLKKALPKLYVDAPLPNLTIKDSTLNVKGWALNSSGVKEVNILLDGTLVGKATIGISRPDVNSAFPGYRNGSNCGYEYTLNASSIYIGKHTIIVQAVGFDGTTICGQTEFNMYGLVQYVQQSNSLSYYIDKQFTKGTNVVYGSNVPVTRDQVKYYMNPNNFINDPIFKYMFLKLNYTDGITAENLNLLLKDKGVLNNKGDVFLQAGRTYNVNPIYLVSHALLETGSGTSQLATGIVVSQLHTKDANGNITSVQNVTPRTTYNMYGIGAEDSNANMWGSEKAYREGWFTIDDAIIGGAKFIASDYIGNTTYNQNTLYKMKWNYDTTWHEYATDIGWAQKQTYRIKQLIDQMVNPVLNFEIPTFKPETIVLDAGHGGTEKGAVGPTGLYEKDVNLAIALKVGEILANNNINVVYTRTTDVNVTLQDRVSISNNAKADYFVSIQSNSYKAQERDVYTASDLPAQTNGIETYYYPTSKIGQALASSVQSELVNSMKISDRGLKTDSSYVVNNTSCPAVLTEVGYISNAAQEALLGKQDYIQMCAQSIANGILKFMR